MSMTTPILRKKNPDSLISDVEKVSVIWDDVVSLIIQKMLEYSTKQMPALHANLREEMALELAKLAMFISEKVVIDRLQGRLLTDIDEATERDVCFNEESGKGGKGVRLELSTSIKGVRPEWHLLKSLIITNQYVRGGVEKLNRFVKIANHGFHIFSLPFFLFFSLTISEPVLYSTLFHASYPRCFLEGMLTFDPIDIL